MKNEQGQQPEAMNSNALGNISVLSPSQRREQERLRKEKEAKDYGNNQRHHRQPPSSGTGHRRLGIHHGLLCGVPAEGKKARVGDGHHQERDQ